jgi:molybdenum cofactor synthesis domain-containing protein
VLEKASGFKASGFDEALLLSPAQALATYFARAELAPPRVETVALADAFGRILARPAIAREDHPSHARSTMDGFAFAATGAPERLRVVGEVCMGVAPTRALAHGEAMRVPTGGALPMGADAVVPQEDVTVDSETIVLVSAVAPGEFVTQPAEDVRAGEAVLAAGRRIGGPELGVLATLGYADVAVYARPRIAVLSTGDELVDVAATLRTGQIRDSNRFALAGSLFAMGAQPVHEPRVPDTREALRDAFAHALDCYDAVITTGGSSVGALDLVPEIVAELGSPGPIVHGLRVKPGKPTLLAAIEGKPVIGLPGNPTSALTILEAVAQPIIAALTGEEIGAFALAAIADAPFVCRPQWTWFVPVTLRSERGTLHAAPLRLRSAQTSLLARANGYATVSGPRGRVEAGEVVYVRRFSSGGAPIAPSPHESIDR